MYVWYSHGASGGIFFVSTFFHAPVGGFVVFSVVLGDSPLHDGTDCMQVLHAGANGVD